LNPWVDYELAALKKRWPDLEHTADSNWVILPNYKVPEGWDKSEAKVAFQTPNLPGEKPYAFWVEGGLLLPENKTPASYAYPDTSCPLPGQWGKFSWELDPWAPGNKPGEGTGMVNFVQSFGNRLREMG
jgi:hypothetical protein